MKHIFERREWLSIPGAATNEDGGGSAAHSAWLLDGATGLPQERLLPGDSDARWLVSEACSFFERPTAPQQLTGLERPTAPEQLTGPERPTDPGQLTAPGPPTGRGRVAQHLGALSAFLSGRFQEARVRAPSRDRLEELPSASLAFAMLEGQSLTIANIGDCRTLVRFPGDATRQFGDSPVTALDAQVVSRLVELQQADSQATYRALRSELAPLIRGNRLLKNQPHGYWVLEPVQSWVQYVQYFTVGVTPGTAVLMLSDGFYRLVDHYHLYSDETLLAAAVNEGLEVLAQRLRQLEDGDPECRAYPRLKPRDDATALLLAVEGNAG